MLNHLQREAEESLSFPFVLTRDPEGLKRAAQVARLQADGKALEILCGCVEALMKCGNPGYEVNDRSLAMGQFDRCR